MKQYEKCDPARNEAVKKEIKVCHQAAERWVDNIFAIQDWAKKANPGLTAKDFEDQFPICKDLDYPEFKSTLTTKK